MTTNSYTDHTVEEEYGEIDDGSCNKTTNSDTEKNMNTSEKVVGAAAIAGGVAGLALCGPVVGLVGAVGVGTLAATQPNKAGDVARASGDVVIAAGERAKELNQKHEIVEKTKRATKGLVDKGKEIDEKHHISEKTQKGVGKIVQKTKEFEEKHRIGEKAGKTMTKGLEMVSNTLRPKR